MANKQYLIELAVKDDKLRSSLKKSLESPDIQKTLGILGDGITEYLEKDIQKATSILGKVNWSSLLGEKDFERLQQLVAKTVSANKDLIKSFVKSNDVQGIQNAIELVSELGNQLKAINPDMTVAGLARSMASFIKVVEPLSGKLNEISNGAQNFQNILNNFDTSTINNQIKEISQSAQGMIDSLNKKAALNALEKGIQEVYGEAVKLQDVMLDSDAMDAYLSKFKTAKAITEEMTRLMNEAKRGVHKEPIDRVIFKQYLEGLQGKLTPMMPTLDGSDITKEVKTVAADVEGTLKKVEEKLEESFNTIIEKKLGSIKVAVDVPTEDKLIADINGVIEKVNTKGTNSLKLVGAESAIKEAQKKILEGTQEWHNKMKDALKFSKKEDIELDLGVKLKEIGSDVGGDLRRSIEEYFDNPANKVAVPVELILTGENKAILEGGGNITINGGVGGGGVTAEDLMKLLTTPIEVAVQEEQQKQKPSGKLISLNPGDAFSNEVLDVFDELFKAIERGGENARKISEFFTLKGLDLSALKGKGEMDILSAFESFLERGDKSVLDDVDSRLAKGSTKNKATTAFRDLLRDSVFRFNLDNITTKEDVKRRQVRTLVEEDYVPKSIAQESLYNIRNTNAKDYKIPTIEELDKLMEDLPNVWGKLGEDFLPALESLKQLRSEITDPTNASEIKRFQDKANEFATETDSLYKEMKDFMGNYRIGVFNKGHNKHNNMYDKLYRGGVGSGSKILAYLDKIDYFELYDDPSGHFSRGNRKDAMDNASSLDRYQLRRDSRNAPYRTREPERTSISAEDIDIPKFKPKEQINEELQAIQKTKEDAQKRTDAMEEARKASEAEEKAAEELRKQQLAADKKKLKALRSQRTKNANKLKDVTDTSEIAELTDKNKQLDAEIKELADNVTKNNVEPSKKPTVKQQLDAMPKAKDIQTMIDNVNAIDAKVEEAQKRAEELDEFVSKKFKAEKVPKLNYTKSEKNNSAKYNTASTKSATLDMALSDKTATKSSFAGLNQKEANVVKKLLTDRKLNQLINGETGLGLPQNSNLENYAKSRIQSYQNGLNKIDEFLLKYQDQTIQYVEDDSDLTEFLKDRNVRYMMAGNFNGSKEEETALRNKIDEFKARMTEAGKGYIVDYLDMWSDSNLRGIMQDNKTRNSTTAQGDTILQEFYRRIVEGGVAKRGEAYQYLKGESAKYEKSIAKDEAVVGKLLDSAHEQLTTTEAKETVATDRLQAEYKQYISQWLQTIQQNIVDISSDAFSVEEKALKIKKNEELRGLISRFASDYFKTFHENLLDETQKSLLNQKESVSYTDLRDRRVSATETERTQKQSEIDAIIVQKSELLRQRRFDLLKQIGSRAKKGDDTKSLEKALLEIEDELVKYSDQLPHWVREEFEADLLNAKNATEEEWSQFRTNSIKRRNEFDSTKYAELKGKQTSILSDIAQKTKAGELTDNLEEQLKDINKEILQFEVNTSRLKDVELAKFPNDASIAAIKTYNNDMAELVKLQQERALLEAKGESTVETDRAIAAQQRALKRRVASQIESDKRTNANYAPAKQATDFIEATDKAAYILDQRAKEAENNLKIANGQLAKMQSDEYKNSDVYRRRIDSLKNQDVADYVRSDEYKASRQKAIERANEEFGKYLAQHFDEDTVSELVYEFSHEGNRGDRANMSSIVTPKLKEIFGERDKLLKEISETDDETIKHGLRDKLKLLRQEANKEFKKGNMGGAGIGRRLVGDTFSNMMTKERQKYTDGDTYQRLASQKKEDIEREIEEELKSEKEATEAKVQEIKNASKLRKSQIRKSTLESSEELRMAVDKQARADGMGDSEEYKRSIVDRVKEDMLQQVFEETGQEIREQWKSYKGKVDEKRSERYPDMYKELDAEADNVAYNAVMSKIRMMLGKNAKVVEGLDGKRDELVNQYTKDIIEQYKNSLKFEETNMYTPRGSDKPVNIREMVEKELANKVDYYERQYIEASGKLGMLEHERNRAKSFGELGYDETLNPEIAKVRAEAEARLTAEKAKQVELTERLTNLTSQNADKNIVQSVAAALHETEKEISRLQLLTEGASEALTLRQNVREEEKAERALTPEKQRLWFIDHIEEAKKVLESGTDKEKEQATNNIARWEQKLANVEKIIEASKPESEKPRTVLDMITYAIRDGLAGVTAGGTVDLDASLYNIATETTLQEILRLLGGNDAVEYANQLKKELEKDRPRYDRKHTDDSVSSNGRSYEKKSRRNTSVDKLNEDGQRIYNELDAQAKIFTDKLKENGKQYATDFDFVKAIKDQATVVRKQTKGSLEYIQEQTKLTVLYQDYYKKTFGSRKKKGQPGQSAWAEKGDLGKIEGLKDLLLFKSKRADALVGLNYGVSGAVNTDVTTTENKPKKTNKKKTKSSENISEVTSGTDNTELQQIITDAIKTANSDGAQLDNNTLITKVLGPIMQTLGLDPNDEDVAKIIGDAINSDGLGRDDDVKTQVKDGVKEGVAESSKTSIPDKKHPYEVSPDSIIGKLQNTVGGDTGKLARQETLALVLSELQTISKKIPTVGKSGVKNSAQNLLEEFQKMAMGSAMDSKERVSNFDLVNGAMSPALSGAAHSISQRLLDALSEQYGVGQGYRSQVHTHANSDQTWFSAKDLDHFKKNLGEFGADSIKQQVLLTKDNITVFDMTMVETAEKAALAIDILKKAGSNIDNETLEKLTELGARYQSKNLGSISAKGLMDLLGVKNFKNDGKSKNSALTEEEISIRRTAFEQYAKSRADATNSKDVFNSFDGETFKYQLVDTEGHISRVILAWDELNNKVRVVSDTSTSAIDSTVKKIQQYKSEIQSAKNELLLSSDDDSAFIDAEKKVDDLVKKIDSGKLNGKALRDAIAELETARQKLADEGAKLHKLIAQNEKLRGGTAEVKQTITQGTKVRSLMGDAIGTEDRNGLQLFNVDNDAPEYLRNYVLAYNDLVEVQQKYINDGKINNPKIQDALKVQAARVKKLGIEAMAAYRNTAKLQEQSDASMSLTYTNSMGKEYKLGGSKAVGDQGVNRDAMLKYAQEVLGADLASVKFNTTTGKLTGVLRKNNYVVADMAVQYDKATGKMHLFQEKERESLSGMPGFLHGLKAKSKAIIQYVASMTSIYRVLGEVRKGIQYIRDIDLALTELKKVTDETEETYDKFLQTAAKTGARLGSTISAVTEATATFAKLGYTMKQASEMAEAAIVYKNVGDNIASTEDAADSIISTLKGFGLEASESMAIVDRFNEVGNKFAITSQGIGEALRLSASALNEGKNSLDESIAMITAANEVVNDPSSVGTALKTLTLRLRGSKTELEEMGEDVSDMATTTSQLQAKLLALTGGKVDIMLDENTFKNSTQILREMAEAWEDMDDISRASALELMGGKRQANVLSALIQNFDTVEEVIETSANSAGSALVENERYLDSIQGKIDQFTNTVQAMWSNLLDAEWVKRIVEIGTWLIKIIDGVEILGVKIGGVIPTLLTLVAVIAKVKYGITWSELFTNVGVGISKLNKGLTNLARRFGMVRTATVETNVALNNLTVGQFNHAMATAGVDEAHRKAMRSQMGLTGATNSQIIAQGTLTAETLKEAVASGILNSEQAALLAQKYGLTLATVKLTEATAAQIMTEAGLDRAQKKRIISALGLTMQTKTLTREEFLNMLQTNGVADANERAAIANLFFKETNEKLRFSFKSLGKGIANFLKQNALLLAIAAAVAAIALVIKGVDTLIKTSEELKEKLSESQSALEATTSELKDLRNELDEVNKAIQELQTQGTLSFTDQSELNRLRDQRRELESTIALKSQLETAQQKTVNKDAQATYDSYKTTNFKNGKDMGQYAETGGKLGAGIGGAAGGVAGGVMLSAGITAGVSALAAGALAGTKLGAVLGSFAGPVGTIVGVAIGALAGAAVGAIVGAGTGAGLSAAGKDVEEQLDAMKTERDKLEKKRDEAYRAYIADPENEKLLKKYEKAEEKLTEYDSKMAEHVAEIQQMRNQMDWSTATPSQRETIEEMDDFIDRYNIIMKSQGAVGNAIERILGYDRYDGISEKIEELVEKYKETEDETILTQIGEEAKKAQADLADVNLSIQDVVDYYTLEKGLFDTSTIEGITNQYLKGIKLMQELADNTKPIEIKIDNQIETFSFDDLFEQDESGKFKAREKEFSEMLRGMDEKAQNTFKKFAEHVRNGELIWSQAMEAMKHSANLAGYEFVGRQIADANAEIFKGIKDDINGTIDTFGEFKSALEDVATSMELLYKAQEQMNSAGRLSVQTALEIIESTDNWNDVLDITNGTITLQGDATKVLVQDKLDLIKANIENEIQQLEEQKSTILAQDASNDFATTIEESTNLAIRNMAGSMAYLTTMMEAYTRAANGEKINTEEFLKKAEKAKLEAIDGAEGELDWKKNSAEAIGLDTINKRLEDAYARQSLIGQIDTVDEFKNNYDFDNTPGDKYNESAEDLFQKEMDYWENRIGANQAKFDQLQNEIDRLESRGQKAGAGYYQEQIKLEGQRLQLLRQQKAAAQSHLDTLEGSEEWWEVANTLNDIEGELDDVTASIVDLQDAIGEIDTYKFEEFNTRLDNLVSKLGTIRDLIAPNGEEDWFDDEGNWTETGIAALGTYLQELEFYKQGYQDTVDELSKYQLDYAENEDYYESIGIHSEQEYYDKTEELISQQYDYAESINDTEQSVVDMYESSIDATEEYIDTLIDGYNDYIDSVKEALDAERNLYDFKKNVEKQAKDISELERRIASLSGSTNKADIAERRKLEAQLYESRESLNDAYYDHAKDAQQEALDAEASAYEETMTKMVEGMRTSLEEATANMDTFLNSVTIAVSMNADAVLKKYQDTNVFLDPALTNPWEKAKTAVGNYGGDATKLMDVWKKGGYFAEFSSTAGTNLSSPWSKGSSAVNAFKSSVTNAMKEVVSDINSNVNTAAGSLSKLYQQIKDMEAMAASADLTSGGGELGSLGSGDIGGNVYTPSMKSSGTLNNAMTLYTKRPDGGTTFSVQTIDGKRYLYNSSMGAYFSVEGKNLARNKDDNRRIWESYSFPKGTTYYKYYAKGTSGTTRDEWALTDEPQFGDELTMYATPEGTLSFMRAGSTVVPADITANLVEWGKLTPDMLNVNGTPNINMISNAVNKPELNITFDSLVKAENITEETLPAVKKLVTQELNRFTKELNYALKGKGAR